MDDGIYIYGCELFCADCIAEVKRDLGYSHEGQDERAFDSSEYPKGPSTRGENASERPDHCAHCGVALGNDLIDSGIDYVKGIVAQGGEQAEEYRDVYYWIDFDDDTED